MLCATAGTSRAALVVEAVDAKEPLGEGGGVTVVDNPKRAGAKGLQHRISGGNRAEVADDRVPLGSTNWYGWSFMHPGSPGIPGGGHTIVLQMFVGGRPAGNWPCGGAGHKLSIRGGALFFDMQASSDGGGNINCRRIELMRFDEFKDKWVDVVLHAKWTPEPDGFIKLWMRVGGDEGQWKVMVDHKGRSNANGQGPYLKLGAYTEGGANRTVYTDEYRRGDASSKFEEVAPGAGNMGVPVSPGDGGTPMGSADAGAPDAEVEPEDPQPEPTRDASAGPRPDAGSAPAPSTPTRPTGGGMDARRPSSPGPDAASPGDDPEGEGAGGGRRGGGGCSALPGASGGLGTPAFLLAVALLLGRRRRHRA